MSDCVLADGYHHWVYAPDGRFPDAAAFVAEAHALGAVGVLLHCVGTAGPQLAYVPALDAACRAAGTGLQVTVAIGSRGPGKWLSAMAQPVVAALRAGHAVMMDCEGSWDPAAGADAANRAVDYVLARVPDAVGRVTDCAWWCPRSLPGGGGSHAGFPTQAFGRLCGRERYPQCYTESDAIPDGVTARKLRWARDPSQYQAVGTPASRVFPSVQLYRRSVTDHCALRLAEPRLCGWQSGEMDDAARRGMQAAAKIRAAGFADIASYQRAAGLVADSLVGPRTLESLGVA